MATPYTFRGIGAGQRRTGMQTMQALESTVGRALTPQERQRIASRANYTDPTGGAEIDHNAYNDVMRFAASEIPDGGGVYEDWAPQGGTPGGTSTLPNEGPLTPDPFVAPTWESIPGYERPAYQRFTAPTPEEVAANPAFQFRQQQALGAVEGAAGAAGMSRSSRKFQTMATLAGDLAGQEYDNVYNRGLDEHRYGYGQDVAGAEGAWGAKVADWEGRTGAQQRAAELTYDRNWQKELYGRDDARTREFFNRDDAYRRYAFDTDMAETRRRFLAQLGAGATV